MKYIILWAFLNVHTGTIEGPYTMKPYHEYTAEECSKALLSTGPQKPNKDGKVLIFECVKPGERATMQYTEIL